MRKSKIHLLIIGGVLLAGCSTSIRSISHSGYPAGTTYRTQPGTTADAAFEYRGELSEFDVLGIPRGEITSEADIGRALETARHLKLRPSSSVLLIQSGALFPDGPMVTELSKHFHVVPFSGVPEVRYSMRAGPQTESSDPEGYAKSLRLIAARGGAEYILCYWGMLESDSDRLPTKTVSWVPIVNWLLPDEKEHLRIQLKMALVDVRTGNWSVLSPKLLENARITISPRRAAVDQAQVERLKRLAYQASVTELVDVVGQTGSPEKA